MTTVSSTSPDREPPHGPRSRREFLKCSSLLVAGGAVARTAGIVNAAHPQGGHEIRFGVIGCGGRGTGAAAQALNTTGPTRLVALADVFTDRLQMCLSSLEDYGPRINVPKERQFVGFDGYQKLLEADMDLVILATPPGFRPLHFAAAVAAGKHIFMEKPVAVDAAGVQSVLLANHIAKSKHLAVAVGLQRRHERRYRETIERIQQGAIGDVLSARVYWNSEGVWTRPRQPQQSEMEYQMRNWYYFNWLCGDHIVEQHIHNLDVINWLKQAYPVSAQGMGGRQYRNGTDHGQIFDHHFVEFTYADGTKMFSQCRHIPGCWNEVAEYVVGTKGKSAIHQAQISTAHDDLIWQYGDGGGGGHQQEHHDLFADLRTGAIPNEGDYGAMSTMTAILGRQATYSGQEVSMQALLDSGFSIGPDRELTCFADTPPVIPDELGRYPVPIPGNEAIRVS